MNFYKDMDKLLHEIRLDINFIKRYLSDMQNDNISIDILAIDNIISNLTAKVYDLYI